jgi:hypothetical protein
MTEDDGERSAEDDADVFLDFKLGKDKTNLQAILNDSEEEYPRPFHEQSTMIQIFSDLEDQNLQLI